MTLKQLLLEKREEILKIAAQHGAFNVRVFGSVARGEDIDYEVSKISPWFPGGLLMDLENLLGCKVDIVTEKGLHYFIRDKILHEAIKL